MCTDATREADKAKLRCQLSWTGNSAHLHLIGPLFCVNRLDTLYIAANKDCAHCRLLLPQVLRQLARASVGGGRLRRNF